MEDKQVFKFWIALGLIVTIFFLAFAVRVHAYETTEFQPTVISWYPGSPLSETIYPDQTSFGAFQTTMPCLGFEFSNPVPYYADGDHYSIFAQFTYVIDASLLSQGNYQFYIGPYNYALGMPLTDLGTEIFRISSLPTWANNHFSGQKGFRWLGDSGCSCKYSVFYQYFDVSSIAISVYMVLDINLTSTNELYPLRMGFLYHDNYSSTQTYTHKIYNTYSFNYTDTSLFGLLEGIETAVNNIDFSSLSDLADLSNVVNNFYESYVQNASLELGILESIYDDDSTDPDITDWGERASEFESKNEYMHSLEDSMIGTLADFTFPDAPDASNSIVGNVVLPWFENPITIALILSGLALMIVFAIL